ncbi:MAG: FGGY family carbohydrate kinase [Pseudomonadota bacterium]
MVEPLVVGLDSSTTATKAIAFTAKGAVVGEGRASIPMQNPRLGHFEQNPDDWWASAATALKSLTEQVDAAAIKGLAVSNQRETIGFFDAEARPVRPAMLWLDERSRGEVKTFAQTVGEGTIHALTGRMPDLTPAVYRLAWMKANEPAFADVATFADVQSTLVQRLCGGPFRTGWPSADPLGLFELEAKRWSPPILTALGLDETRLPRAEPPGTILGTVSAKAALETGLKEGTPIIAGGGDGQLAGLGTGCTIEGRAYINLGTAVVSGVWSKDYLFDKAWRTEIAAQGEGYIFENCLRSGTFLLNWFVDQFVPGGRDDPDVYKRLEAEALDLPIGSEGVMVLPYWSGVMDPHWDVDARGAILGLSASHRPAHVYRAILEAITLDQVSRTATMEAAMGRPIHHYVAIGGGAASPLWRQMLADASGKPVYISTTNEASALGAAMIAAAGAGLHDGIVAASEAMVGDTTAIAPNPATAADYAELGAIYTDLYGATAGISHRLVARASRTETPQ